jgi:integral membrane sensor domain MASE1
VVTQLKVDGKLVTSDVEEVPGRESSLAKRLIDSVSPKDAALFALLTLGYFISTRVGLRLALVQPFATPIWLPAGGVIAALIVFGYRVWPAVLVGSFLGHITSLGFVGAAFVVPVGATLEGLAGAYLVNTFAHGVKAFETAKDVFRFAFFTCICAPSINAAVGIAVNYFGGHASFANSSLLVLSWWLAHGIAALVLAPFFILLVGASHHRLDLPEFSELIALLLGLFFVCLLVFGPLSVSMNKHNVVRVWLCVPFLIWAAFRFCPLEAAGTTLILFGSAIGGTLHGYGPFVSKNLMVSLVVLDSFVGVIGTMTLVVAAMVVERRRMEEQLLGVQSLLQAKVANTVQALDTEIAVHARTKKSLQDNQEQFRLLAARTAEKGREVQSST